MGLSERERRCLAELRSFAEAHGYVPTMQELADRLHCSKSTVSRYLSGLQRAGYVRRVPRTARGMVVSWAPK